MESMMEMLRMAMELQTQRNEGVKEVSKANAQRMVQRRD
jgi:hypothetical protein